MNYFQSPNQSSIRFFIQLGVPLSGGDVRRDPESGSSQNTRPTFDFHDNGISVEPTEEVTDRDGPTKFIDDDICLAGVTIPKLCVRVFRVCFKCAFSPRSPTFSRSSSSPIDFASSFNCCRCHIIFFNAADGAITSDSNVCRNCIDLSKFRLAPYSFPITL